MDKIETVKRYILFIVALFFIGLGIAFTKHSQLGVSPVSSVTNVMSVKFQALSFGTWVIIANSTFLLGQILLLRKNFQPKQFLQIPLTFLFGWFTDFGMWLVGFFPNEIYTVKLLFVFVGSFILALGITLSIIADVILNSAEGFTKALAETTKKDIGTVKIVFDLCWVAFSVFLSLIFFNGRLEGVREGTIVSAFLVGMFVKVLLRFLSKPIDKLLLHGRIDAS